MISIYTDGSCVDDHGGWAAVLVENGEKKECSGYVPDTTNNAMEMMAVLGGLRQVRQNSDVTVYTDSKLVIGWLDKHWRCNFKHIRVIKASIVETIKSNGLKVKFHKVNGHSGHEENELAHALAREAIDARDESTLAVAYYKSQDLTDYLRKAVEDEQHT